MVSRNRIWAKKFRLPLNLASGGVISDGDRKSVVGLRGLFGVLSALFFFLASVFLFLFVAFAFGADFFLRVLGCSVLLLGVEFFAYLFDFRIKLYLLSPESGFDFYVFYSSEAALDLQLERILEGRVACFSMYSFFKGVFSDFRKRKVERSGFDITDA